MSSTSSGTWSTAYTSDSKLYFNPSTGTLNATNLNSLSDIKFKKDVYDIENAIETLNSIRPVSFKWIENDRNAFGIIAQEIEKLLPDLVETSNFGKSVSYIQLIPIIIKALKELQEEIVEIRGTKQ